MEKYYVSKNKQDNGDHEVHKETCDWLPKVENRIYLGWHSYCVSAVNEAKKYYSQVNGCYYCSINCHNS